jgi:hypothetical protein
LKYNICWPPDLNALIFKITAGPIRWRSKSISPGASYSDEGVLHTSDGGKRKWMYCVFLQARRTLSGLLRKGKEALRESDPGEAVLAAKQVCAHDRPFDFKPIDL